MFTTRPELSGTFGMASSTHWLASTVGMGVLERGGNAFDAATTMAFVLHIAEPHMCGPAGDVPILFATAGSDDVTVLCGQGPAPANATIEHYRSEGLDLVPATGLLATAIPGATPAWLTLLRDHGTWSLAQILEPAIGYASNGCPVHPDITASVRGMRRIFERDWPTSAELWLRGGAPPQAGGLYRNPALAATWRRLILEVEAASGDRSAQLDAALDIWCQGFIGEALVTHSAIAAPDAIGGHYTGVLNGQDMLGWRPGYEAPVTYTYEGMEIAKCGPWSQGPVLLQGLALLRGIDLAGMDVAGAEFVHVITEAMKLAYADREVFYGDPLFVDVPLEVLLSDGYNNDRRTLLAPTASENFRPGIVKGYGHPIDYAAAVARADPAWRRSRGALSTAEPTAAATRPASGDTVHLDVVDRWGNLVSATPSGGWLQASPTVAELGFPLGSRAQMFWLDPDHPSSLLPGKRPRTTLTPSLARRDGRPWMAFGSPGGDGQDQWQLAFLLRLAHGGLNLQEAIEAPAFHSDHWPSSFWPREARPLRLSVEDRFGPDVVAELQRRGHDVAISGPWSEGRLSAVTREADGMLRAGANPRGMQGYAVGR